MRTILGCRVPDATLESWSERLAFEHEPLYLTDDARALLPAAVPRSELPDLGLDFADAYLSYAIPADASWAALLEPAAVRALPKDIRGELMRLQARLGRGQLYPLAFVETVLGGLAPVLERDTFDTPDGPLVALRRDAWRGLPREARHRWLETYVSEGREACRSSSLNEADWADLTRAHGPALRSLAGTFAAASGPNCFATTLAAVTGEPEEAARIAARRLFPDELERGLLELGFRERGRLEGDEAPPGAVLAWVDAGGRWQHACLVAQGGLALNKDAQGWHAPRHLLPLGSVLRGWAEDGLEVRLHTRGD